MAEYIFYTNDDFITNRVTGGTRRFIELVEGLVNKAHRVHLFIPAWAGFPHHPNLVRHPVKRKESRFLPNGLLNFLSNYPQLRRIRKMKQARPVFVSIPYALQAALAGIKGSTLIVWEDFVGYRKIAMESKGVPGFLMPPLIFLWRWMERFTLLRVDRIVVQCRYDKQLLLRRHAYYVPRLSKRITVLRNNVNPSWIKQMDYLRVPSVPVRADRQPSPAYQPPFQMGFIGNLDDKRKGLHLLLRAYARLSAEGRDVLLHVMGDGRYGRTYRRQYRDYPGIIFHGHLHRPMQRLAALDMLVVPSLSDSFPNTVMEALYLGIPVLGSRKGGIPEMLYYEDLLFEPRVEALYFKLKWAMQGQHLGTIRDLCSRRRKSLEFDWVGAMQRVLGSSKAT